MKNRFILLISLFCVFCVNAFANESSSHVIFSLPKSGNHFIYFFCANVGHSCPIDHVHRHKELFGSDFTPQSFYEELKDLGVIFIYRDPRDAIVSYVDWVEKIPDHWKAIFGGPDWDQWSESKKILEVIRGDRVQCMCENGSQLLENIAILSQRGNCIFVRFEDFIGPRGGGNLEAQISTMRKVLEFIGEKKQSNQEVIDICNRTFGPPPKDCSGTFNKPGIGKWKDRFNEEHIQTFKNSFWNEVLLELGYETDPDW